MSFQKITALILAGLLVCTSLASCKGEEEDTNATIVPETVEPISDEMQTDYTQNSDTVEQLTTWRSTFADMEEAPAADFKTVVYDGKLTLTDYTGRADAVRVPAEIDGMPVVAIADNAFAQMTFLKKLYLPDGITALGTGVLKGCTELTALRTPILGANTTGEQYLGYLFGATKYEDNPRDVPAGLKYLELGGNMEALADFALFDCNDLVLVTLPDSMKTLGTYSMYQCSSLLALNTRHLTSIAEHALDACSSLTRLEFGEELTSIGLGALEGCMGLRVLTLPFVGGGTEENNFLGYVFGATVPDHAKGYYPPYLTEVYLLTACAAIGNYAFYECESLESVHMQEGIATIGVRAFAGCTRLEQVTVPDSVTSVRENAFFGCLRLQSVTWGGDSSLQSLGINTFYQCGMLKRISLPASLQSLPASCFAGCASLEEIDLGGVKEVGKNAFRHCTALTHVEAIDGIRFEDGNDCAKKLVLTK